MTCIPSVLNHLEVFVKPVGLRKLSLCVIGKDRLKWAEREK